jgi:hypothetical protein
MHGALRFSNLDLAGGKINLASAAVLAVDQLAARWSGNRPRSICQPRCAYLDANSGKCVSMGCTGLTQNSAIQMGTS